MNKVSKEELKVKMEIGASKSAQMNSKNN